MWRRQEAGDGGYSRDGGGDGGEDSGAMADYSGGVRAVKMQLLDAADEVGGYGEKRERRERERGAKCVPCVRACVCVCVFCCT